MRIRYSLHRLAFVLTALVAAQVLAGCAMAERIANKDCVISPREALSYTPLTEIQEPEVGRIYRLQAIMFSGFERAGLIPFLSLDPGEIEVYGPDAYCFRVAEQCLAAIEKERKRQDPEAAESYGGLLLVDSLVRMEDPRETGSFSLGWCAEGPVTVVQLIAARPMFSKERNFRESGH